MAEAAFTRDFHLFLIFFFSRRYLVFAIRDVTNLSDQSVCLFRFAPTHRDIMEVEPARNAGFTNQEYSDMLIVYGACNMVGRRIAEEYCLRFPNRRHPDAGTFTHV